VESPLPGDRQRGHSASGLETDLEHSRHRAPQADSTRATFAPDVGAALSIGWTPSVLAAFAGANTLGVRSPAAVLAARLSPGELPAPPDDFSGRPGAASATIARACWTMTATPLSLLQGRPVGLSH
jgi:hypothetical protein